MAHYFLQSQQTLKGEQREREKTTKKQCGNIDSVGKSLAAKRKEKRGRSADFDLKAQKKK
jgi:hypothetical protein